MFLSQLPQTDFVAFSSAVSGSSARFHKSEAKLRLGAARLESQIKYVAKNVLSSRPCHCYCSSYTAGQNSNADESRDDSNAKYEYFPITAHPQGFYSSYTRKQHLYHSVVITLKTI